MADRASSESDLLFGKLVVEQGLAKSEQVEECLQAIARLAAEGVPSVPRLGELLVRKGYLSQSRFDATIRLQDAQPTRVHGTRAVGMPPEAEKAARETVNVIEKYIRVSQLGVGGMGEVWRAWDRELGRWVALKFLKGQDPGEIARFEREAQTAAKLSHPNIAAVYAVGEHAGKPYLAMQIVEGQNLVKYPRDDVRRVVEIMRDAARAVQYAHDQGIVHRDLKPHNIMVEGKPAAATAPRVYVMDFGLAKQATMDSSLSVAGSILGTPAYMPPEQARGDLERVTARSDVYSLGATLYELLTDRPPFVDANVYSLLRKVAEEEPRPLRTVRPRIDSDLETIVMKCLEKDPHQRFASAAELADDLERWRTGEAIRARPASTAYRTRKFLVRHRTSAVPIAVISVLALAFGTWSAVRSGKGEAARIAAESDKKKQEEALNLLEQGRPVLDRAFRYLYSPDAVYEELEKRVGAGQTLIEQALEKSPRLAVGHYLLGRAWDIKGDSGKAEASWRRAIELDPTFGPPHFHLGRLLLARSFHAMLLDIPEERDTRRAESARLAQEAGKEIEAAKKGRSGFEDELQAEVAAAILAFVRKDVAGVRLIVASGIAKFGRTEGVEELHWLKGVSSAGPEEIEAYDRALQLRPNYPLALLSRGSARMALGDLEQAVTDFTDATRISPRFMEAYSNRCLARQATGDFPGALKDSDEAIRLAPGEAAAWANRANVKHVLGDLDGALKDATEAIRLNSRLAMAYVNRAGVRRDQGDLKGALEDCTEALRLNPRNADGYNNRGLVKQASEDLTGALADFREALKIDPGHAKARCNQGYLKQMAGDLPGAIADQTEAIRIDPRCGDAYVNRASARLEKGEPDAAIADCDQALKINRWLIEAWHNRGLAKQAKGDFKGAIADSGEALKLNPKHGEAYFNRGNAYHSLRKYAEAIADFDETLKLNPKYVEAYANRALAKSDKGDAAGAAADLKKALELAPPDWPARLQLEAVLRRLEKK